MSVGPIPISKIRDEAQRRGMNIEDTEDFVSVMRAMDSAYMEWVAEEQESKRKDPPKKEPEKDPPSKPIRRTR